MKVDEIKKRIGSIALGIMCCNCCGERHEECARSRCGKCAGCERVYQSPENDGGEQ